MIIHKNKNDNSVHYTSEESNSRANDPDYIPSVNEFSNDD